MSAPMSVGRRSGISPVTLIAVIILAMIAGAIAFAMYARQVKEKDALAKVQAARGPVEAAFSAALKEAGDIKREHLRTETYSNKGAEFPESASIAAYFETHKTPGENTLQGLNLWPEPAPGTQPEPKNFRMVIDTLQQAQYLRELLHHDMDKRILAAARAAAAAEDANEYLRNDYARRVALKTQEAAAVKTATEAMDAAKNREITDLNNRKAEEVKKYKAAQTKADDRKGALLNSIETTTRRNAVVRREIKVLRVEPTVAPPSGHIVRSDWRTEKVIINLGKEKVFPGLVFEVYYIDNYGRRMVKGKVEVFQTLVGSSVANIVQSDPEHPIVAGDAIQTPFAPFGYQKRFVIAGIIPEDAVYNEDQLKALIRLNGGEVQDAVGLKTDVLILGETSLAGAGETGTTVAEDTQKKTRSGRVEAEKARELGHEIVGWRTFQESLRR